MNRTTIAVRWFLFDRRGDCLFWRPSPLNTRMNSFVVNSSLIAPFPNRLRSPVDYQKSRVSPVSGLFFAVGPSTVLFGIAKRPINSIDGVINGWSWPHVGNKVFKAIFPFFAHNDTAIKIKTSVLVGSPFATAFSHKNPCVVLFCRFPFVWVAALTMLLVCKTGHLLLQASARLGMTIYELIGGNKRIFAARTSANPCDSSSEIASSTINLESTKCFS